VRYAKSRLIEGRPRGESADRHGRVALVPEEPAVIGRLATGIEFRVVEDRIARAGIIRPRRKMGNAQTELERQPLGYLPGILQKSLERRISDIVYAVERRLIIRVQV